MNKRSLKSPEGYPLKMFTVVVGNSNGIFHVVHAIHSTFAYNNVEAIEEARQHFKHDLNLTYEVKGIVDVREYLEFLRDNIESEVFGKGIPIFVRQPKYISAEAAAFIQKLLDAAPILVDSETEQRILTYSLSKIKKLYENTKVSGSNTSPNRRPSN